MSHTRRTHCDHHPPARFDDPYHCITSPPHAAATQITATTTTPHAATTRNTAMPGSALGSVSQARAPGSLAYWKRVLRGMDSRDIDGLSPALEAKQFRNVTELGRQDDKADEWARRDLAGVLGVSEVVTMRLLQHVRSRKRGGRGDQNGTAQHRRRIGPLNATIAATPGAPAVAVSAGPSSRAPAAVASGDGAVTTTATLQAPARTAVPAATARGGGAAITRATPVLQAGAMQANDRNGMSKPSEHLSEDAALHGYAAFLGRAPTSNLLPVIERSAPGVIGWARYWNGIRRDALRGYAEFHSVQMTDGLLPTIERSSLGIQGRADRHRRARG